MFDFRYHAVSLASVFIALVVGLLLGVAIGDANLVSNAERNLRDSLRSDLNSARADASSLRQQLSLRTQYESAAYPALVGGKLAGRRYGLVFLGSTSDDINQLVRSAIDPTGGTLVYVAALRNPVDLAGVAGGAAGTRYSRVSADSALVRPLGVRVGLQLVRGGRLLRQLQASLLSSYNGTLGPVDGIVVVRQAQSGAPQPAEASFESGLAAGLGAAHVPVVGVETTTTNPSEVPWYQQASFASVDDLDDLAGRTALVYALDGAHGAYGVKSTAERLLPQAPATPPASTH